MPTASQQVYRREQIAAFETSKSLLLNTGTRELMTEGLTVTFLVSGRGSVVAFTRGASGEIVYNQNTNTQSTATLVEYHAGFRHSKFDIFASQGDQRRQMQTNAVGTINARATAIILAELETGTQDTGAAVTASLGMVTRALGILQTAKIPQDGNIFCAISPAFNAYLSMIPAYASADFANTKPLVGNDLGWNDQERWKSWMGVNWIMTPEITGAGTTAEKCLMWHRSALGIACNTEMIRVGGGYDEQHDRFFEWSSIFMAARLLQNTGVVVINHDGSAIVAE